jgi:hypothetical protein
MAESIPTAILQQVVVFTFQTLDDVALAGVVVSYT